MSPPRSNVPLQSNSNGRLHVAPPPLQHSPPVELERLPLHLVNQLRNRLTALPFPFPSSFEGSREEPRDEVFGWETRYEAGIFTAFPIFKMFAFRD